MKSKQLFPIFGVVMILCLFTVGFNGQSVQAQSVVSGDLATVVITPSEISWTPLEEYTRLYLRVAKPDGEVFDLVFEADQTPLMGLQDPDGNPLADGLYRYELVAMPKLDAETLAILAQVTQEDRDQTVAELKQAGKLPEQSLTQTGAFYINNGSYAMAAVEGEASEVQSAQSTVDEPLDVVHLDDAIVDGSLCVGFDCLTDGSEIFDFDTIKLKENNLRIYFDDTSSTGGFTANDWRLIANDSASGGSNYFSIEDSTGGNRVFTIEAGAPANSIYVEDLGRVGLGTSIPVLELSINDSDSPSIRLEQDSSGGWAPQTFDIAANESNFFIRDVTNGSKLPFRIQPNAPTNSLTIKSSGYVGIGTWAPTEMLHVAGNVRVDGYIVEFSDVNVKMGFLPVDGAEILQKLLDMPVTTWSYKAEGSDVIHMGPTAQDFYAAFGLGDDNKHIAALDTNGVALAAIQELARLSQAQDARITALEQQNADMEQRIEALEKLVAELAEAQK